MVKKSYKLTNSTKDTNLKKEELNDSENSEEKSEIENNDKIIKEKKEIRKNKKNISINFSKIEENKTIDSFKIDKNFDFEKYNVKYSWDDEDFITEFTKKSQTKSTIYLVCSKRGNQSKNFPGKAKFIKNTGRFIIYEKKNV